MNMNIKRDAYTELLAIVDNNLPVYQDACAHGSGDWVCSFSTYDRNLHRVYDLYVFEGNHICIRCSSEDSDYLSPGFLDDLLRLAGFGREPYATAAKILSQYGKFSWKPNK